MASPISAANAYAALARLGERTAAMPRAGGGPVGETSFSSILNGAIGAVVEAGRKSDGQTQQLVAGKSNLVDVVTAVSETEVAVQALVSVRDRVIQSYEEIMRMPI